MTRALELLVRYGTRADVHALRTLAPAVDRAVMLKLARDSTQGDTAWCAQRALALDGDLADDDDGVQAAMRVVSRYVENSVYDTGVAHALAARMLSGTLGPYTAAQNRTAAIFTLAQLVRLGATALLVRQFTFVRNNFVVQAERTDADDEEEEGASEGDKGADEPSVNEQLVGVLGAPAAGVPFLREMAASVVWCYNVAGCLLRLALAHTQYDTVRELLERPEFYATLSAAALDAADRACASALLGAYRKQRDGQRIALVNIPSACVPTLEAAVAGLRGPIGKRYATLALIERLARRREKLAAAAGGDEVKAYAALAEEEPDVRVAEAETKLDTLECADRAIVAALLALRPLLAAHADTDAHVAELVRVLGPRMPDADELDALPDRGAKVSDEEHEARQAEVARTGLNNKFDPLLVSEEALSTLMRAYSCADTLDTAIGVVHALYRFRLACVKREMGAGRAALVLAQKEALETLRAHRAQRAEALRDAVRATTADAYFGADEDDDEEEEEE